MYKLQTYTIILLLANKPSLHIRSQGLEIPREK